MVSLSEDHVKKTINIKVIFLEPLEEQGGPGTTCKKHENIVRHCLQVAISRVFEEIMGHHHLLKQPRGSKPVMEQSIMTAASGSFRE